MSIEGWRLHVAGLWAGGIVARLGPETGPERVPVVDPGRLGPVPASVVGGCAGECRLVAPAGVVIAAVVQPVERRRPPVPLAEQDHH